MYKLLLINILIYTSLPTYAQNATLQGRVTSQEDNSPLPGVSIVVKGTSTGTTTDADGRYRLEAAPGSTLIFNFIGFRSQEVSADGTAPVNITLASDSRQL